MDLPKRKNSKVIEREGIRFVQDAFERNGWVFTELSVVEDYGVDAQVEFVDGEHPTNRRLNLQVKSGPSYFKKMKDEHIGFWERRSTWNYWLQGNLPTIIVLYSPDLKQSFWVRALETLVAFSKVGGSIKVPRNQTLDSNGFDALREILDSQATNYTRQDVQKQSEATWETEHFTLYPAHTPQGVRYDIYGKAGAPLPLLKVRLDQQDEKRFQAFIETGQGSTFRVRLEHANFLPPQVLSPGSILHLTVPDNAYYKVYRMVFAWTGDDGHSFSRGLNVQMVQRGTKKIVIRTTLDQVDYIRLEIDLEREACAMSFTLAIAGTNVLRAHQALTLQRSVAQGGLIELKSEETEIAFMTSYWKDTRPRQDGFDAAIALLSRCVDLQRSLGKPLTVPEDWFTEDDLIAIQDLHQIIGKGILELGNCTVTIPAGAETAEKIVDALRRPQDTHNVAFRQVDEPRRLLGQSIPLGHAVTVIHNPRLEGEVCLKVDCEPDTVLVPIASSTGQVQRFYEAYLPKASPGSEEGSGRRSA